MNNKEAFKQFINKEIIDKNVINKNKIIEIIDDIYKLFFVGYFEEVKDIDSYINKLYIQIHDDLVQEIAKVKINKPQNEIIDSFMNDLVNIRKELQLDIAAITDNDPAAESEEEIIIAYPGIYAIFVYRLAHKLYLEDVKTIPRIMSEYAHSKTGIDIHPGATIGKSFFIDHGSGIVIGETSIIGDHVKIYQGVTIGAKNLRKGSKLRGLKRHPTIMNNVTIYANASILGGNTVIGNNVIVGSNVFITSSIPDNFKVLNKNYDVVLIESDKND